MKFCSESREWVYCFADLILDVHEWTEPYVLLTAETINRKTVTIEENLTQTVIISPNEFQPDVTPEPSPEPPSPVEL